jgi:hypothetical protein
MKRLLILLQLALAIICSSVNAQPKNELKLFYKVQKNNWAAQILRDFGIKPLYGESGAIKALVNENKFCESSQCNLLRPGDTLYFSSSFYDQISKVATVLPTGEVILKTQQNVDTPTPAIAEAAIQDAPEIPFDPYTEFKLVGALRFIAFKGSDYTSNSTYEGKAELAPSLNLLARSHGRRHWGWMSELEILNLKFAQVPTGDLHDLSHTIGHGFFGVDYYSDKFRWGFSGGLAEYFLYSATSQADVNIDQSWAPVARIDVDYGFKISAFSSHVYAAYDFIFPHNVRGQDTESGSGYKVGTSLGYPLKSFVVEGVLEYRRHQFDRLLATYEYYEVYGGVGISWRK